jgi:hypothetical protein
MSCRDFSGVAGAFLTLFLATQAIIAFDPTYAPSAQEIGKTLCGQLDPNRSDLSDVRKLASQGKYAEALDAWRDWKVMQIRGMNLGQFNWHEDQRNGGRLLAGEVLVGKVPAKPVPYLGFTDYFGLSGPPDLPIHPDWLAKDASGHFSVDYSHFFFASPLCVRYWQSGDPIYLRKWFQITADFACNQKHAVESLDAKVRKDFPCNWSIQAGPALTQGDRVTTIIRSLGVFCKSLPDGGKPKDWGAVNESLATPVPAASIALIPSVELAQIALSLVHDHPVALLERYAKAGAVPNQRRNGLAAMLLTATTFPELTASPDLFSKAGAAMDDYLNGALQHDGGMLEQSFNYNLGDANSFGELSGLIKSQCPELSLKLLQRQGDFYRTMASLATPIGKLPAMSSASPVNPPPVWRDSKALQAWLTLESSSIRGTNDPLCKSVKGQLSESPLLPPPAFTSVAFPYSGYYVQRIHWRWDSPWMFMQASRPGRGHHNMGHNALQVTAYGRPLLVSAGPPVYNPGQLPPEARTEFDAINKLLGEDSSLKVNTVMVDGHSQGSVTPAPVAQSDTIATRWHNSPCFDLMEGYYDLGYSGTKVTHRRFVIFVRDFGFWIVTDIMQSNDDKEHTFTQNWNLPGFQDQGKTQAFGFKRDQVVIDPAGTGFHTVDPEGPNLWMNFCGGGEKKIVMHFGEKNPYLGWFSPGFGSLIPAPELTVDWKSVSNSVLVTVICPVKTKGQLPFVMRDTSGSGDQGEAALQLEFQNGNKLEYRATATPHLLKLGADTMNAQAFLSVKPNNGPAKGLVIGRVDAAPSDFEFVKDGSKPAEIVPIKVPKGFVWRETPRGVVPDYSSK